MQGLLPYHVHTSFKDLIEGIETKLVDEMEKQNKPNWSKATKEIVPYIMWTYTNSDVDASKDRKMEGKYENSLLSLSLCDKEVIKKNVSYPITDSTLHP